MNEPRTPSLDITWQQPAFLLPLFCLCPLLAATTSLATGVGLSAVLCVTTMATMLITFVARAWIPDSIQPFAWIISCSTITAITELLLHAWHYALFRSLGLFLPLTVIACLLMTRSEMQAEQKSIRQLMVRAAKMNAGFLLAAVVVGSAREIVGDGTLFSDAASILGVTWHPITIEFFPRNMGFLLAVLAPGAFIGLGIGVAFYNWIWIHLRNTSHHD